MTSSTLKFLAVALLLHLLPTGAMAADLQQGLAAYQQGRYTAALALLGPLAEQGDPQAQFTLGLMSDNGEGLIQDHGQAFRWFRRAAEQGHGRAQRQLGRLYFHGLGVARDPVQAYAWFNLAAAQSDDPSGVGRHSLRLAAAEMSATQLAAAQRLSRTYQQRYAKPTAPVTVSTPPPAAPPTRTAPPAPASGDDVRIQLASMSSASKAGAEGQRIQQRHPALLGNLQFTIQTARLSRGTVHRIQAGPMSQAQASFLCEALQRQNQPCLVIHH